MTSEIIRIHFFLQKKKYNYTDKPSSKLSFEIIGFFLFFWSKISWYLFDSSNKY